MDKPPILKFVLCIDASECTVPGCRSGADVRMETNRSRSRGWLCAPHAYVAMQRWIKRENGRRRLEFLRSEFQKQLAEEEGTE
jgi:hypothetical protein